ncbi:MAG: 3-hydroxyacyl-CoA dehydrogenase family protein, partial [Sphingomicrobium sp.]
QGREGRALHPVEDRFSASSISIASVTAAIIALVRKVADDPWRSHSQPAPSPLVQQIIEDFAKKQGIERREIGDEEIVERTLYTMVNEGAKSVEEGIAQRASDVAVVWVYGYGWPVYRGGPMFWADTEGLQKIVDGLKRQEERMKPQFSFSKLLLEKAANGEKFTK